MYGFRLLAVSVSTLSLYACRANDIVPDWGGIGLDAMVRDADLTLLPDGPRVSKAFNCAEKFGQQLTDSFMRLDGTVVAVVTPEDKNCAKPNSDHLIIQIKIHDAIYRMLVTLESNGTDKEVRFVQKAHALVGGAWQEGWHTDASLDYPSMLQVHHTEFKPYTLTGLANTVTDRITLGAPISVFASSSGGNYADSAHLIHRNRGGDFTDGAVVIDPKGSPQYLLFHFADQEF